MADDGQPIEGPALRTVVGMIKDLEFQVLYGPTCTTCHISPTKTNKKRKNINITVKLTVSTTINLNAKATINIGNSFI